MTSNLNLDAGSFDLSNALSLEKAIFLDISSIKTDEGQTETGKGPQREPFPSAYPAANSRDR